jgi:bisphosphoglycerate-dependent phosphoglycerate mutase
MKRVTIILCFCIVLFSCNKQESISVEENSNNVASEVPEIVAENTPPEIVYSLGAIMRGRINSFQGEEFDIKELWNKDDNRESYNAMINNYKFMIGKTKEQMIEQFGSDYQVTETRTYEKDRDSHEDYALGYSLREKIEYSGFSFEVFSNENESYIKQFTIRKENEPYFENIFIGCDFDNILHQLGKPNYRLGSNIVPEDTEGFTYSFNAISVSFLFNKDVKLIEIYGYENL